jgi:hypothetical protein
MTFMNGNLHDVVYFKQPPRFVQLGHEFVFANTLCFTWTETSPRVCWDRFLPYISRSYKKYSRYNLYYLKNNNKIMILALYVDDLFIIGNHY